MRLCVGILKKEFSALVNIFSVFLIIDYGFGNQFIEFVHGKASKDFLMNKLRLFRMAMLETNNIFQFTKRSFDFPSHSAKHY